MMLNVAILNNKLIYTKDIYKFGIPKNSFFVCYFCNKALDFCQSKNENGEVIKQFYHKEESINTQCDDFRYIDRKNNKWYAQLSNNMKYQYRELIKYNKKGKRYIVDCFDNKTNRGVQFQHLRISIDDIKSIENCVYLDWIFDITNQYVRKVNTSNFAICEIPSNTWKDAAKACKNFVFLDVGCKQWLLLENKEQYRIEVEDNKRNVWICKTISFEEMLQLTCLQNTMTEKGKKFYTNRKRSIKEVSIIYGRCEKSMLLLDDIHRNYVNRYFFKEKDVIGIKSVAGSGKTATLLELSKTHSNKRVLYLAYDKNVIKEMENKSKNVNNLIVKTFDSLMYEIFVFNEDRELNIKNIRPQTIQIIDTWFNGKSFETRKYYVDHFNKFCKQFKYNNINRYISNVIGKKEIPLAIMWKKAINNEFNTYESIRKLSLINRWCKNYIDEQYDMIFIDEAQDFDIIILKILLRDTNIPKIFIGDTMQSIYQYRGCINVFDELPKNALIIEFYSTFRIGNPACEEIRNKFENCWMISRSKNETYIEYNKNPNDNYVYLFRSWRCLLETAEKMENIWINNYDKQAEKIKKLHYRIRKSPLSTEEKLTFPDDLPIFLKELSNRKLNSLLNNIRSRLVNKKKSKCQMYTIHSYKGLQSNIIKIHNDIDKNKEKNLYYVALTRGKKKIVIVD